MIVPIGSWGTVAEWSQRRCLWEKNKWKPRDPRFAPMDWAILLKSWLFLVTSDCNSFLSWIVVIEQQAKYFIVSKLKLWLKNFSKRGFPPSKKMNGGSLDIYLTIRRKSSKAGSTLLQYCRNKRRHHLSFMYLWKYSEGEITRPNRDPCRIIVNNLEPFVEHTMLKRLAIEWNDKSIKFYYNLE